MKLIEHLESPINYGEDYITFYKMEALMKKICNEKNEYIFLNLTMYVDNELVNIQSNKHILFSINPDLDFPRMKHEYVNLMESFPEFNEINQNILDNMKYIDKIDTTQFDKIPEHIKYIYCHSVGVSHPKVKMIPLGRDFKNEHLFSYSNSLKLNEKSILIYYNVTLPPNSYHWYGMVRQFVFDIVSKKEFIYHKNCYKPPRYFSNQDVVEYYNDLSKSKFMICPRGCGIDTYRLWDCIHMGCIPIVEKYDGYKDFEDLPILFIDSWKELDLFTIEYLENTWNELIQLDYNYEKLKLSYWEKEFLSHFPTPT